MFPRIPIGNGFIMAYNVALLGGIVLGWIAYLLEEDQLWKEQDVGTRFFRFATTSLAYLVIVICCIQGATYFHFLFDNIPQAVQNKLTLRDMLFANPLKTTKVLYGVIFFFPVGVFLVTIIDLKGKFWDLLNRKAFIVLLVVGCARVGCFLNGCCYGICSDTFGVSFPMNSAAAWEHLQRGLTTGFIAPPSLPVIPTQAISAVVLFTLTILAFRAGRKGKEHIFVNYVFYYAVFRFLIEFVRADVDRAYYGPLSSSQWISLFVFAAYGAWKVYQRRVGNS